MQDQAQHELFEQLLQQLQQSQQLAGSLQLHELAEDQKWWHARVLQEQSRRQQVDAQQLGRPTAFVAQLPLSLSRPMNPFDAGTDGLLQQRFAAQQPNSCTLQQPGLQLHRAHEQDGQVTPPPPPQQQQQQLTSPLQPHCQPRLPPPPGLPAQQHQLPGQQGYSAGAAEQGLDGGITAIPAPPMSPRQQRSGPQPSPSPSAGRQPPVRERGGHQTSLLDALAVAAAVVSKGLLASPMQLGSSHTDMAASMRNFSAAAAAAAAEDVPPVFNAAGGNSSQQAPRRAAAPSQATTASTGRTGNTTAATPAAAAAAAGAAAAGAAAASPSGSSVSRPGSSGSDAAPGPLSTQLAAVAAEARGGGPYHKSLLLDLADQLGGAAVATAQAAAERGEPLSYAQVMQLLQPLEEGVKGALGAPLQEVPGWQLDDVRRMFFFTLPHSARHFGMGATRFKPIVRSFGIGYWPQRQFMSIVEALNFLRDRSPDGRDAGDVPGRMLVLQHSWHLLNKYPNMQLDGHPASAVKAAIHKQSHKQRQKQLSAQQAAGGQPPAGGRGRRKRTQAEAGLQEAESRETSPPAVAAATAAGDGEEAEQGGVAAGSREPSEVVAQVHQALAVWPPSLQYLAQEAAAVLMVPHVD